MNIFEDPPRPDKNSTRDIKVEVTGTSNEIRHSNQINKEKIIAEAYRLH